MIPWAIGNALEIILHGLRHFHSPWRLSQAAMSHQPGTVACLPSQSTKYFRPRYY